nr:FeoA family protein [Corynebacterium lactis]
MFGLRSRSASVDAPVTHNAQSLADLRTGHTAVLAVPEVDARLCRRLAQLGLRPGMSVTVGQSTAGGGRVIRSGGTRYAIDAATLRQMYVS